MSEKALEWILCGRSGCFDKFDNFPALLTTGLARWLLPFCLGHDQFPDAATFVATVKKAELSHRPLGTCIYPTVPALEEMLFSPIPVLEVHSGDRGVWVDWRRTLRERRPAKPLATSVASRWPTGESAVSN